ncbi:MAG: type II toxin-antitoxin system HicB family antitoxin [bacterium]
MKRYAIVIERGAEESNFSAYAPDLPGCIAVGDSIDEVRKNMKEAMELHLHGILHEGEKIPAPQSTVDFISVSDDPSEWAKDVLEVNPAENRKAL